MTRGLARLLAARLGGRKAWAQVTLLVTLRCDSRCAYCDFPRHAGAELEPAEVLAVLRALQDVGVFRLSVSGGEPLLRPDLPLILAEARRLGFVTSLVTNGLRLADRAADLPPVDYVITTIEGDEETHDRVRGRGSWQRTCAGLARVRARGGARLGVICPVHRGNTAALGQALETAERFGAQTFYQPVQLRESWSGPGFDGEVPDPTLAAAFAQVLDWKRRGRAIGNSYRYLRRIAEGPSASRPLPPCTAGQSFVTMLPDGRVLPCCMLPFEGAWPRFDPADPQATVDRVAAPAVCRGCTIGPYVENNLLFTGDLGSWLNVVRWRGA